MVDAPISAKLVVEAGSSSGLSAPQGAEGTSKKTNQLLRALLRGNSKMLMQDVVGGVLLRKAIMALPTTIALGMASVMGLTATGHQVFSAIAGGLQGMDPATGEFDPDRVLDREDFANTEKQLDITPEEAQDQANTQGSHTSDTTPLADNIEDELDVTYDLETKIIDWNGKVDAAILETDKTAGKVSSVNTAFDGLSDAIISFIAKIAIANHDFKSPNFTGPKPSNEPNATTHRGGERVGTLKLINDAGDDPSALMDALNNEG